MKLEIYRRELNEYNMVGACGYVVNAKRPTTAVRRFTKAVKESNKLNEAEKERIIEFVEDEKVFVEMLKEAGSTNAHDKEWSIDLEEIEEGYWYVSVSASIEKENQEGETVETPSTKKEEAEATKKEEEKEEVSNDKETPSALNFYSRKKSIKAMKKLILLERLTDTWTPNKNMFNNFTGFKGYESEAIKEFNNLNEGLQALKKCVPVDYSYPGKIEIISYALSIYKNDVMSDRYEWAYKKTEDGIVYKLEKTM